MNRTAISSASTSRATRSATTSSSSSTRTARSRASRRSRFAELYAGLDVRWFEEPVSSDDLAGLRLMRDRAPAGMEIAAGEYGYTLPYFQRLLDAGAVDCLQADVTRCEGITGFLKVAALCDGTVARPVGALRALDHCIRAARFSDCGISSTSTITYASSGCCSTA